MRQRGSFSFPFCFFYLFILVSAWQNQVNHSTIHFKKKKMAWDMVAFPKSFMGLFCHPSKKKREKSNPQNRRVNKSFYPLQSPWLMSNDEIHLSLKWSLRTSEVWALFFISLHLPVGLLNTSSFTFCLCSGCQHKQTLTHKASSSHIYCFFKHPCGFESMCCSVWVLHHCDLWSLTYLHSWPLKLLVSFFMAPPCNRNTEMWHNQV